jgi:hypothetical protein
MSRQFITIPTNQLRNRSGPARPPARRDPFPPSTSTSTSSSTCGTTPTIGTRVASDDCPIPRSRSGKADPANAVRQTPIGQMAIRQAAIRQMLIGRVQILREGAALTFDSTSMCMGQFDSSARLQCTQTSQTFRSSISRSYLYCT